MFGWQWYQTSKLAVVPYMKGTPVYKDGMLPFLYFKLKEEQKLQATFCGVEHNLDSFISYLDRLKTVQILCEITSADQYLPVGFSWIDNPRGVDGSRVAMPGEAFFDGASRRHSARDLARLALAYSFEDLRIDIFHGIQEVSNIAARNFSVKLGFKQVAIVPKYHFYDGELRDARVMMLEKKDFWPGFITWKQDQDSAARAEIPMEREAAIA